MDSIPIETLTTIIGMAGEIPDGCGKGLWSLRYRTLRFCALVARRWRAVAQEELWRRLQINGTPQWKLVMENVDDRARFIMEACLITTGAEAAVLLAQCISIRRLLLVCSDDFDACFFRFPSLSRLLDLGINCRLRSKSELPPSFRLRSLSSFKTYNSMCGRVGTLNIPPALLIASVPTLTRLILPTKHDVAVGACAALERAAPTLRYLQAGTYISSPGYHNSLIKMDALTELRLFGDVSLVREVLELLQATLDQLAVTHGKQSSGLVARIRGISNSHPEPDYTPLIACLDLPATSRLKKLILTYKEGQQNAAWWLPIFRACTARGAFLYRA